MRGLEPPRASRRVAAVAAKWREVALRHGSAPETADRAASFHDLVLRRLGADWARAGVGISSPSRAGLYGLPHKRNCGGAPTSCGDWGQRNQGVVSARNLRLFADAKRLGGRAWRLAPPNYEPGPHAGCSARRGRRDGNRPYVVIEARNFAHLPAFATRECLRLAAHAQRVTGSGLLVQRNPGFANRHPGPSRHRSV